MRHFMRLMVGMVLCVGLSAPTLMHAEPATRSPGVNRRERHQRRRIKQGVKSGELTKDEAKKLRNEQKSIHREEREMKSDGSLTAEERAKLRQDQNAASKDIYEEKHDDEKR